MITLPIGILLVGSVLWMAFQGQSAAALMNLHSIIIVCLGTFAILLFSTPFNEVRELFRYLNLLLRKSNSYDQVKDKLLQVASNKMLVTNRLEYPLIAFATELWEQGVDDRMFKMLMTHKLDEINASNEKPITTLKNLAKYPPALGMTGTVIGMIALFSNLGSDNKSSIGPALALAMTATFYGLALANFLIMPLADRLHVWQLAETKNNELIFQSLLMIHNNEPIAIIETFYQVTEEDLNAA